MLRWTSGSFAIAPRSENIWKASAVATGEEAGSMNRLPGLLPKPPYLNDLIKLVDHFCPVV